ncbi:MAG: ATP-binding protein, partial [Candidatus Entotheonellia bacterium]
MAIQVKQITGDIVELIFNPREDDLRVGENLSIVERDGHRGLIVQIIEFRTVSYPSLVQEQLQLALEGAPLSPVALLPPMLPPSEGEGPAAWSGEAKNLKLAIAKIRKLTDPAWHQWDGWIPTRDVLIAKTADREVFQNCIPDLGNGLHLGKTLSGEEFYIEGRTLEKVNIVTGVKGSGKSHLAKVILLELISHRAPCVVFDINREYIHLPRHDYDPVSGEVRQRGILHLLAGGNLKLSIQQFGLSPLITMLTKFGLPEVSAMYFENRVARLLDDLKRRSSEHLPPPFLSINDLIQMARNLEFSESDVVNGAILSRLEAIKNTGVFATHAGEALSIREQYERIRDGGAVVVDLSALSNLARIGFVQAIIEIIRDLCETEITRGSNRFPFVFFEEAHLYINRNTIGYIVTRARHLGITSFFVTNMIGGLDETVLRQADNLFILRLPFDD